MHRSLGYATIGGGLIQFFYPLMARATLNLIDGGDIHAEPTSFRQRPQIDRGAPLRGAGRTPNIRTCYLLTPRDGLLILSFIPLKRALSSSARWVSAIGFSISRKGLFGPEKSGSGKPNRMSFPQRRTLMKSKSDEVGGRLTKKFSAFDGLRRKA